MDAQNIDALKLEAQRVALERFGATSSAEIESILAVLSYEQTLFQKHGKRQQAAYTWRMLREHGIIPGVERVVTREAETQGYKALTSLGLQDFAFEAVVVRHPEIFSKDAVEDSKSRLRNFEDALTSRHQYWWVNHKQTFKAEFEGGYIWSPKANTNGARNRTYDNLTHVAPGDIVFSYADGLIKAIGVASKRHSESIKPEAFGLAGANWADSGWLVPIEWTALPLPVAPKAYIVRIQPLLPQKHSPLQANGNGNQGCYLAAISPALGRLILDLTGKLSPDAVEAVQDVTQQIETDLAEIEILIAEEIPETEKEQLVRSRRGQGLFRQRVLQIEPQCRLTGVNDQSFLIASHIKPWRDCANDERLDGSNGLMLAPHIDKLFDRGWISFSDNGDLLSALGAEQVMAAWNVDPNKNVGKFHPEQCRYLDHHRRMVFKGVSL